MTTLFSRATASYLKQSLITGRFFVETSVDNRDTTTTTNNIFKAVSFKRIFCVQLEPLTLRRFSHQGSLVALNRTSAFLLSALCFQWYVDCLCRRLGHPTHIDRRCSGGLRACCLKDEKFESHFRRSLLVVDGSSMSRSPLLYLTCWILCGCMPLQVSRS